MAKLEAEVTANIGPFEKALSQAAQKAKEFAAQTKDVGKDIFKETAGGGAFKMVGLGGAAAAATAFGVAVVEASKEGLQAFGKMEQQVLQLKYNLKDPSVAREVHDWIKQIALGTDDVDKLQAAFVSLSESGLGLEESKQMLQDLQAVALKSGSSVDELAEAFRRAKEGGLDAGEGASRLLKALPGLSREIEKQKTSVSETVRSDVGRWDPAAGVYEHMHKAEEEADKILAMTPADFLKSGYFKTANLEQAIHAMAPRGMVAEERQTLEGTQGALDKVIDELKESLGEGLAPAVKQITNALTENLPEIESALKEFGQAVSGEVGVLVDPQKRDRQIRDFGSELGSELGKGLNPFTPSFWFGGFGGVPVTPGAPSERQEPDLGPKLDKGNDIGEQTLAVLRGVFTID
jgi:hypothetical protein